MGLVLEDMAAFAQTAGLGTPGVNLFTAPMPATPDTCVQMLEYGGPDPELRLGGGGPNIDKPRFQFIARAKSAKDARALAMSAYVKIGAVSNQTINGTYYLIVRPVGSVAYFQTDSQGRIQYVVNFHTERKL